MTIYIKSVNITKRCGFVQGVIYGRIAYVLYIHVEEELRNKGFGTILLLTFIKEVYNLGCVEVKLEDMSDNFNKSHNLYKKIGFKYIKKGEPEMYVSTRKVMLDSFNVFD